MHVNYRWGCSYGGELAQLNGLARLGEMIFILRSHIIFYLSSIKKFVMSLEKDCLIKHFFTIRWRKAIMQNKFSYLINIWKVKQNWLKKMVSHLAGLAPGWPTWACSYGKFSFQLGRIAAISSEIQPRRTGSLLIWTHYIFIRVS